MRPPIRTPGKGGNPNVREKTVAVGRAGTRFEDLSDKEAMHRFVKQNKHIVDAQSQEIDLIKEVTEAKNRKELDVELNPSMRRPENRIKPQQPPSLEEQREYLRLKNEQQYKEEYDPEEDSEEQISIHDIVYDKTNDPDWLDEEAKTILATLPGVKTLTLEQQKLIYERIPPDQKRKILGTDASKSVHNKSQEPSKGKKISNIGDENGLIDAPPIPVSQLRKKIEQEMAEKLKNNEPLLLQEKPSPRFIVRTIEPKQEDYQAFNPVSGFVFYDFDHSFVRKFNIADADNLHMAKASGNLADFVHAVGATLKIEDFSVLDFSVADLRNLLYWHQFNSFLKTPLEVEWTSKYGNKNYYRINDRSLKYKTPVISKEQYIEIWKPKGLTVPTVRDWLFYQTEDLTVEEEFLCNNAQWFIGDKNDASFQSKIDSMTHYCSRDLDAYSLIPEFSQLCAHGIIETVDVVDAKFDPQSYLDILNKELQLLYNERKELEDDLSNIENTNLDDRIVELNEIIMDINDRLKRKEVVEADVETRPINMSMLDFFPRI